MGRNAVEFPLPQWRESVEQEGAEMQNGTDLYALDIHGALFVKACGVTRTRTASRA